MHHICSNCKYSGDRGCAVNPSYWEAFQIIDGARLTPDAKGKLVSTLVNECAEFEMAEDLEEVAIEITLTKRQWQQWMKQPDDNANIKVMRQQVAKELGEEVGGDRPQSFVHLDRSTEGQGIQHIIGVSCAESGEQSNALHPVEMARRLREVISNGNFRGLSRVISEPDLEMRGLDDCLDNWLDEHGYIRGSCRVHPSGWYAATRKTDGMNHDITDRLPEHLKASHSIRYIRLPATTIALRDNPYAGDNEIDTGIIE